MRPAPVLAEFRRGARRRVASRSIRRVIGTGDAHLEVWRRRKASKPMLHSRHGPQTCTDELSSRTLLADCPRVRCSKGHCYCCAVGHVSWRVSRAAADISVPCRLLDWKAHTRSCCRLFLRGRDTPARCGPSLGGCGSVNSCLAPGSLRRPAPQTRPLLRRPRSALAEAEPRDRPAPRKDKRRSHSLSCRNSYFAASVLLMNPATSS